MEKFKIRFCREFDKNEASTNFEALLLYLTKWRRWCAISLITTTIWRLFSQYNNLLDGELKTYERFFKKEPQIITKKNLSLSSNHEIP